MSSREIIRTLSAAAALLAVGCDSPTKPDGGKPPVIPPPSITCPAAPEPTQTTTMQPVVVTYGAPVTSDGTQPVTVSCTPPSGSAFPVGSSPVTCTVTDAIQRTASCSFTVVVMFVPPAPHLSVMKFVAFGDSITAGAVPDGSYPTRFRVLQLLPPNATYPGQLQGMLRSRYMPQAALISVVNAGLQGEAAVTGAGRLPAVLSAYNPDVLLLLEGVNDLNDSDLTSIRAPVASLRAMIDYAKAPPRNIHVMVGTLLPENPALPFGRTASLIVPFNNQLVPMATAEGATVVDLYSAFAGHIPDWIGPDGLHPNATGYQAMAQVFFDAIKTAFETMGPVPTRTSINSVGPVGVSPRPPVHRH